MLRVTDSAHAPWLVVRADDKKTARLALIHDLVQRVNYQDAEHDFKPASPPIIARFDESCLTNGILAS
jgi:hypothetical protein